MRASVSVRVLFSSFIALNWCVIYFVVQKCHKVFMLFCNKDAMFYIKRLLNVFGYSLSHFGFWSYEI